MRKVCLKRPPKSVKFQEKDEIPLNYRIYPRIGRTFFKEKTFKIWGAAYTRVQEF